MEKYSKLNERKLLELNIKSRENNKKKTGQQASILISKQALDEIEAKI